MGTLPIPMVILLTVLLTGSPLPWLVALLLQYFAAWLAKLYCTVVHADFCVGEWVENIKSRPK